MTVKKKHKKQLLRGVFCAENDEGENCQQRKVLTGSPIRITQFHEKVILQKHKKLGKIARF